MVSWGWGIFANNASLARDGTRGLDLLTARPYSSGYTSGRSSESSGFCNSNMAKSLFNPDHAGPFSNGNVNLTLRPFVEADRARVTDLLTDLPGLYPSGGEWLQRRLTDATEQRATCTLAGWQGSIAGLTLETPKGKRRKKLSTLFVHPAYRNRGLGFQLLTNCLESWRRLELDEVIVTARVCNLTTLGPLLGRTGFLQIAIEKDRYGVGCDEAVLRWSAQAGERLALTNPEVTLAGSSRRSLPR